MAMQPFPRPLADRLRQLEEDRGTEYPEGYELIYSSRRTLAVQITAAGQVRVRAPRRTSRASIDRFLIEKEAWVLKYLTRAFEHASPPPPPLPESERRRYMELAREIFTRKAAYYASVMKVTYAASPSGSRKPAGGAAAAKET